MKKESSNVICIVVTYNRLSLLKEALAAIKAQTYPIRQILVIDNHSTDGTDKYLRSMKGDAQIRAVRMKSNTGGAGGFAEGIRLAAQERPDWIWMMDDDTIPTPDALERLMPATASDKVGFVCSKVVWTDGSLHLMNTPEIADDQSAKDTVFDGQPEEKENAVVVSQASFVSLLIRGDIPWRLGLPYKEFFIWCDDSEYTRRITDAGYCGLMAQRSVVLHKTGENYISSLAIVPAKAAWKVYYGERNESFLRRQRKGPWAFFFSQLNAFRTHKHRVCKRKLPKDEERALLKASFRGLWDGFFFRPKVEYME